jgi:DNA-binding MarR family transcriptional regulator
MIEELARHGYRISPGSLYPLLQRLEKKGYLRSTERRKGKSLRRVYRATRLGRKALMASKSKVRELFHELIERSSTTADCASCVIPGGGQLRPSTKSSIACSRKGLPTLDESFRVAPGLRVIRTMIGIPSAGRMARAMIDSSRETLGPYLE